MRTIRLSVRLSLDPEVIFYFWYYQPKETRWSTYTKVFLDGRPPIVYNKKQSLDEE